MTDTRAIVRAVAASHGLSVSAMLAPNRCRRRVLVRWEAMFRLRVIGLSLPEIGQALGGLHHTTVLTGLRRLAKLMEAKREWFTTAPASEIVGNWMGRLWLLTAVVGRVELVAMGAGL